MPEISPLTHKLIKEISRPQKTSKKEDDICVDIKHYSSLGKRLREYLPWKEKHRLRCNVIERALKKEALETDQEPSFEMAQKILTRALKSGYFSKKRIKRSEVEEVQAIISKYSKIIKNNPKEKKSDNDNLHEWLILIASCEIEEVLSPSLKEKAIIFYMFNSLKEVMITEGDKEEKQKNLLLYIAVQQSLFSLDKPIISYHILKSKFKKWKKNDEESIEVISKQIRNERKMIDRALKEPLLKKFYRLCKRQRAPFLIVGDIVAENTKKAKETLTEPIETEKEIKNHYKKRKDNIIKKTCRAGMFAGISLFLMRALVFFTIEQPIFWHGNEEVLSFSESLIAILAPSFFLLLLTCLTPPFSEKNEKKTILETISVIYKKREKEKKLIKEKNKEFARLMVKTYYVLGFLVLSGIIVFLFTLVNLPLLSSLILLLFFMLAGSIGIRMREMSKELWVRKEKENPLFLMVDVLSSPFSYFHRSLSARQIKRNNLFIASNVLTELPAEFYAKTLKDWKGNLKEKKEKIYQ